MSELVSSQGKDAIKLVSAIPQAEQNSQKFERSTVIESISKLLKEFRTSILEYPASDVEKMAEPVSKKMDWNQVSHRSKPRQSVGMISDSAMELLRDWGVLSDSFGGTAGLESIMRSSGIAIEGARIEYQADGSELLAKVTQPSGHFVHLKISDDLTCHVLNTIQENRLSDFVDVRLDDSTKWIAELHISAEDTALVAALRKSASAGITLAAGKMNPRSILIYRNGKETSAVDLGESGGWKNELLNALNDFLLPTESENSTLLN